MLLSSIDYKQFCRLTASGLVIATFVEIRNTLIRRYKEIFGSDIDVSDGTADGQWIVEQALIINDMLQTIQLMYSQLDPNSAGGKFLEIICSFNNVYRRAATKSVANVTIEVASQLTLSSLDFIDANGTIWSWTSDEAVTFNTGTTYSLQVECSEVGPIMCKAGTIIGTAEPLGIVVTQATDGSIGSLEETDDSLRARRNQSLATSSMTVLEGLVGSLLTIDGIEDVKIYDEGSAATAEDGTSIPAHQIYIVIKKRDNISISDKQIGNIIYSMVTPGILTTESEDATAATHHSYTYQITSSLTRTVYWKQSKRIKPTGTVVIKTKAYWSNATMLTIVNGLFKMLSEQDVGYVPSNFELLSYCQNRDPLYRGQATFEMSSISISNASDVEEDNAFAEVPEITDVSDINYSIAGNTITITL